MTLKEFEVKWGHRNFRLLNDEEYDQCGQDLASVDVVFEKGSVWHWIIEQDWFLTGNKHLRTILDKIEQQEVSNETH